MKTLLSILLLITTLAHARLRETVAQAENRLGQKLHMAATKTGLQNVTVRLDTTRCGMTFLDGICVGESYLRPGKFLAAEIEHLKSLQPATAICHPQGGVVNFSLPALGAHLDKVRAAHDVRVQQW